MEVDFGQGYSVELLANPKSTKELVQEKAEFMEKKEDGNPFTLADLGDVIRKYKRWKQVLPNIAPFYAVKSNDRLPVLKVLADLGSSFDCASEGEIKKVLELGVDPSRIVYANTFKQASFIRYARTHNVSLMTFDNESELRKISDLYPDAKLLIRLLPSLQFKVKINLGKKFGCLPNKAKKLLETAKMLNMNVVGVCFHVGSGCEEAEAFMAAIQQARDVHDRGLQLGFDMKMLDIGGGFPGHESAPTSFEQIAEVIHKALEKYFPKKEGVKIIAEPGRFFVTSAFTSAVNIISKRVEENGDLQDEAAEKAGTPHMMYFVNDGIYGSFSNVILEHVTHDAFTLKDSDVTYSSSVWGPTCDSGDYILREVQLPKLEVNDWLYFTENGAYSIVCASGFNSMPQARCFYYCHQQLWNDTFRERQAPVTS